MAREIPADVRATAYRLRLMRDSSIAMPSEPQLAVSEALSDELAPPTCAADRSRYSTESWGSNHRDVGQSYDTENPCVR
jgi:hypothetical protein